MATTKEEAAYIIPFYEANIAQLRMMVADGHSQAFEAQRLLDMKVKELAELKAVAAEPTEGRGAAGGAP